MKYLKINQSTFIIVANGFADGPAQALRDYLVANNAKMVITVAHPLVPESDGWHITTIYKDGKITSRKRHLPHRPPSTFIFDPFIPFKLPATTVWFGFNNLATMRGLVRRKLGRTSKVFYWAVDFVPQRFGTGLVTKIYDKIDRFVSKHVDGRIDLSQAALDGRTNYHKLSSSTMAPSFVVPMGAWLDRTPKINDSAWEKQRVIYLGHHVERQGVKTLIEAVPEIIKHNPRVRVETIGGGPELASLKTLAKELGVEKYVKFNGFVESHKDVEKALATGTIAVAPYVKDETSFTQFADPGKLKAYLGASLPIVLTNVPPNAEELAKSGAATIIDDSPSALAAAILDILGDEKKWKKAYIASAKLAKQFDWNVVLNEALEKLGFE